MNVEFYETNLSSILPLASQIVLVFPHIFYDHLQFTLLAIFVPLGIREGQIFIFYHR